jgi:O-antigen ligase
MKTRLRAETLPHKDFGASPIASEPLHERPPWLLALLCFLVGALPTVVVPPGPLRSNGSPVRIIAIIFFGLVILGFVLMRRTTSTRSVRPGIMVIVLYLVLILAIYGVGLIHWGAAGVRDMLSDWVIESSKTRTMLQMLANIGVALYILRRVETARQRAILLGCLAIGLTFACAVGVLQQANIDLRYLLKPPGFVLNIEDVALSERAGAKRVVGTSQHAIEFSVLAAVTVPLTIHFARFAGNRNIRWLALLACGLALLAIPAAISRTGVLAIAAALGVYMWNVKLRALALSIVAGAAAIMGYMAAFPAVAHALQQTIVNSEQDESVLARRADLATVSETFRAHPIFGLGLGGSPPSEYGFLDNQWLQAIVQGGIVGLAAMIVLTGGCIFGFSAALRVATTPRERDEIFMLGAMFAAILVSSFTFDVFAYQQSALILFIVFGLLWCRVKVPLPDAETEKQRAHLVE